MAGGGWGYSLGKADAKPGRKAMARGIYQRLGSKADGWWEWMAPLPFVLEELVRRNADRKRTVAEIRLGHPDGSGRTIIATDDDVRTGAWAGKFDGVALSPDEKIVRAVGSAIRQLAATAPRRELIPTWNQAGRLELPPADASSLHQFGERAGTDEEARKAWRELGNMMCRNPKMTLVVGASLGGLFLSETGGQTFVVHLTGKARRGKSTSIKVAGALYGPVGLPAQISGVIQPWNLTKIGLHEELSDWRCLPAFRDELSAAKINDADLEHLIMSLVQGNSRTRGRRVGGSDRTAPWHGVLVSTGNESMLEKITNEGCAVRIVELSTPFTLDWRDSKRAEELLPACWGWPFAWLGESGIGPKAFAADFLAVALDSLGGECGGVEGTLRKHMAVSVAGAALLGKLLGVDGLAEVALAAATEAAETLLTELRERGATPADRLLNAITQSMADQPDRWPTIDRYVAAITGKASLDGTPPPRLATETYGWQLDPGDGRARIAVLTKHLPDLAAATGMNSTRGALRELRAARVLEAGGESDGRLTVRVPIRLPDQPDPRCYVLRLPADPDADLSEISDDPEPAMPHPDPAPQAPPGSDARDLGLGHDATTWPACRVCGRPTPYGDDAGPIHPGAFCASTTAATGPADNNVHQDQLTYDQGDAPAPEPPARTDSGGSAGLDVAAPHAPAPDPYGEYPPDLADEPEGLAVVPEPRGGSAGRPATPAVRPSASRPAMRAARPETGPTRVSGHVVAELDATGLWHLGRIAPVPVDQMPDSLAACADVAAAHGVDRIIVRHSGLADQGAALPDRIGPDDVIHHPWADLAGTAWTTGTDGPDDLLRPYTICRMRADTDRTVLVILASLEKLWTGERLPAPGVLAAAHAEYRRVTGAWWFNSAPWMFKTTLIRCLERTEQGRQLKPVQAIISGRVEAVGNIGLWTRASRALDATEDGALFLDGLDRNAAYPSVLSSVMVGIGEPTHITEPGQFVAEIHGKLSGYVRTTEPITIHPQLDELLRLGAGRWITTSQARMLARGIKDPTDETKTRYILEPVKINYSEMWLWEESAELLRGFGRKNRETRRTLAQNKGQAVADVALKMHKEMTSAFGTLHPMGDKVERNELWRPDWHDMIRGQAQANILKEIITVGLTRGRWPVAVNVDEWVYATDQADPAETARELGMTYDPTGAHGNGWKSTGPVARPAIGQYAGEMNFWAMFRKERAAHTRREN